MGESFESVSEKEFVLTIGFTIIFTPDADHVLSF